MRKPIAYASSASQKIGMLHELKDKLSGQAVLSQVGNVESEVDFKIKLCNPQNV